MKKFIFFVFLFSLLSIFSLSQTNLYIPQIAVGGGYSTTFIVTNTGDSNASVTLSFFQSGFASWELDIEDYGTTSQLNFDVNSNSIEIIRATSDSDEINVGFAVLYSPSSEIQISATYTLEDSSDNLITEVSVPSTDISTSFTLPLIHSDEDNLNTAISVVNVSNYNGLLYMDCFNSDGSSLSSLSTPISLTGGDHYPRYITDDELFPSLGEVMGSLIIKMNKGLDNSPLPFTCMALIQDKDKFTGVMPSPHSHSTSKDTTYYYFPQIADGGGYETIFTFINSTDSPANITISFYHEDGSTWDFPLEDYGSTSSLNTTLNPGESLYLNSEGSAENLVAGYATVSTDNPDILIGAAYEFSPDENTVSAFVSVPAYPSSDRYYLPIIYFPDKNFSSALSILNTTDSQIDVTLSFKNEASSKSSYSTTLTLSPHEKYVRYVYDIFNFSESEVYGLLKVEANSGGKISVMGLIDDRGMLSNFPVVFKNNVNYNQYQESEPDNNLSEAFPIDIPAKVTGSVNETEDGDITVTYNQVSDDIEDIYKFTISSDSTLNFYLSTDSTVGDLDLLVSDGSNIIAMSSEPDISNEEITNLSLPAGTYYIFVSAFDETPPLNADIPYSLTIN